VDLDAYVDEHVAEWRRLEELVGRRRLSGAEADELIGLYQRTATHLSAVQSRSPDPALVARLSRLVSRARAAVAGSSAPAWRTFGRFLTVGFPVAVYRAWPWWCGVTAAFYAVAFSVMGYLGAHPELARKLAPEEVLERLVNEDFERYYSEHPAEFFGAQVITNNALLSAVVLIAGVLIFPTVLVLLGNALGVGVTGGIMIAFGRADVFFRLIIPHGLLELMAVFVAGGVGLRIGWSWIAPGPHRTRGQALAETVREGVLVALGLVGVLTVSGVIEAYVTPAPWPTWLRIGIGAAAFVGFLGYVLFFGRRADRAGETGDLEAGLREDVVPLA